jgi:hypothetical protein
MMRAMTGWRRFVVGYRLLCAVLTVIAIISAGIQSGQLLQLLYGPGQ